jgi:hypothetical protein
MASGLRVRESRIEIMKIDKRDVWGVMRNAGRESEHKSPEYPCKPLFPIYSTRYRLYCTVLYCTVRTVGTWYSTRYRTCTGTVLSRWRWMIAAQISNSRV